MCKISDGIIISFLLACSLSDVRTRKIPGWILIGMSVVSAFFCLWQRSESFLSVLGGLLIGGIFCAVSKFTREAIGYADSWIILLLGAYLGMEKVLTLVVFAFFLAGLFALAGFLWKKWNQTCSIPFVPFLTAAYIGVLFI